MKPASIEVAASELVKSGQALRSVLRARIHGQDEAIEQLIYALFSGGHVLIEGAPGLGKTTLVQTLARALNLEFRRIQFTPDLMPADILGTRMLELDERGARSFRFQKGPLFAQVVLADELNRATPRTQSALLEAMSEGQVSSFGETHVLPKPFFVAATQNPIEMEGTYPLPEAQLDRFQLQIEVKMPSLAALQTLLEHSADVETSAPALLQQQQLLNAQALVRQVPVSPELVARIARLLLATHPAEELAGHKTKQVLRHGASPRGGQALLLAARARALLAGRLHVATEDLAALYFPALRHRLVHSYGVEGSAEELRAVLDEAWERSAREVGR